MVATAAPFLALQAHNEGLSNESTVCKADCVTFVSVGPIGGRMNLRAEEVKVCPKGLEEGGEEVGVPSWLLTQVGRRGCGGIPGWGPGSDAAEFTAWSS